MILRDLTDEELIRLNIEAADQEGAIRKSTQLLIDGHKVRPSCVDDMITGVGENGPYIVLTKHVVLPYTRPESGALESAIGIATLKISVVSGNEANDPIKYLLCLSAKDNMKRLNALVELAGIFEDAQFYGLLEQAESVEEIVEYINEWKKKKTDMYKVLVCCHAGMESSMLLKVKADQVISEDGCPIRTEYGDLDLLNGFSGDLVIVMDDLADESEDEVPYTLGVRNIIDRVETKSKMEELLAAKQE